MGAQGLKNASGTGPCAPFARLYSSSKGNIINHIGGKLYGLYDAERSKVKNRGVTPRQINYLCASGRIPGAVKMAGVWLIPKTAEKPIDGRTKQGKVQKA